MGDVGRTHELGALVAGDALLATVLPIHLTTGARFEHPFMESWIGDFAERLVRLWFGPAA